MKPALMSLTDTLKPGTGLDNSPDIVERLLYLTALFPSVFSEKFVEQIMMHLRRWLDVTVVTPNTVNKLIAPYLTEVRESSVPPTRAHTPRAGYERHREHHSHTVSSATSECQTHSYTCSDSH
jgi:hypothetical protein